MSERAARWGRWCRRYERDPGHRAEPACTGYADDDRDHRHIAVRASHERDAVHALRGGLALLLASLGIYGVLAFSIACRTREIGIRVALGADRRSVTALVLREGMSLVSLGLAIGLGAGFYLSQSVKTFLFDVSPRDPTTFAIVPCVLAAVALLACYVPARRALRVDPLTALRAE